MTEVEEKQPQTGNTKKGKRKVCYIILGVILGIMLILFIPLLLTLGGGDSSNVPNAPVEPIVYEVEPVAYEIVGMDDISYSVNNRWSYRVVVSPEIKENQVEPTVAEIISFLTSQNEEIDEINLFLYSDREIVMGFYDVAVAEWSPNGEWGSVTSEIAENNDRSNYRITVQVKDNLEEYLRQRGQSEDKFGFTEAERRQIFKEIQAAEVRAYDEAEQIYPLDNYSDPNYEEILDKNWSKYTELSDKYKAQVRMKYNITDDIHIQILAEGFEESWPQE